MELNTRAAPTTSPALCPTADLAPADLAQAVAEHRLLSLIQEAQTLENQSAEGLIQAIKLRYDAIACYGYGVLGVSDIHDVAELVARSGLQGLDDLCAGSGYLAALMAHHTRHTPLPLDVRAYDLQDESAGSRWSGAFYPVHQADARAQAVRTAQEGRAMFLSWPSLHGYWAFEAVQAYRQAGGRLFIQVHDGEGGCTGCLSLYQELDAHWEEVHDAETPQWDGIGCSLTAYRA